VGRGRREKGGEKKGRKKECKKAKVKKGGFVDGSHEWGREGSGDCGRVVIEDR